MEIWQPVSLVDSLPANTRVAISMFMILTIRNYNHSAPHFNINTHSTLEGLAQHSDIIVLAVKPQIMKSVCENILTALGPKNPLFISIAAGINQSSLSHWLGKQQAIVRCMPNTPALVQTGATALHANNNVSPQQRDLTENILRAVGIALLD